MVREVFVLTNGDLFDVWEIGFTGLQRRRETEPVTHFSEDGSQREVMMAYTIETAEVSFTTHPAPLAVNQSGQLSQGESLFYEVTVLAIENVGDHLQVAGSALRRYDISIAD